MGKLKLLLNQIKYNLKFRIIFFYMIVFVIFISIFEIFTYISLKDYYFSNIKSNMLAQAKYSIELYDSSISEYSLSEVVLNERFEFLNNIQGQVQILDNTGVLYYDNTGSSDIGKNIIKVSNLIETKENYRFDHNDNLISLIYPIKSNNIQIGILRIISATNNLYREITLKMIIFVIFGLFSILIGLLVLYYFAKKFLVPINKLTNLANKLSDGQYSEKSNMDYHGEIGELARTMDELSENIIKKEEIKTDFISSISHELRTPLTSIKGWAMTLQDRDIDEETVEDGLKIIEKEADRLSAMVEDLLDFSRFTSPRFTLSKSHFDIVPVVKNIVNQLKPRSLEKKINLIYDYSDQNIMIVADENRLKQVFINLIDNAIKFTLENGSVVITIKQDLQTEMLICEVVDTGIGINEDEINLVTTKFYKGTSEGSHTGLGLSIVEEIILQHKGTLEIKSKINEGTTIHFEIPIGGKDEEI